MNFYLIQQRDIEELFKKFGEGATFQYFKSFRRMRVNYSSPSAAAKARIQLHQAHFGDTDINCYFAQPVTPIGNTRRYDYFSFGINKKVKYINPIIFFQTPKIVICSSLLHTNSS